MKDVLGNYFGETEAAVQELIRTNPGITGSEVAETTEAMEVDAQEVESTTNAQDQLMEKGQQEPTPGTYHLELT